MATWTFSKDTTRGERFSGHYHTILSALRHELAPRRLKSVPFRAALPNEFGDFILHSGSYIAGERQDQLVVILHGLGGHPDRGYCVEAAEGAQKLGFSSLRLSLRGADGLGEDFYHAGFVESLAPLLADPQWDCVEQIYLIGFSLGGNVAIRAAHEKVDPRIKAVAAICPPLDLAQSQVHIDGPSLPVYRRSVLRALIENYPRVSQSALRHGLALPPEERIKSVQTIREWDELTIVPRFQFRSVEEYYRTQSSGPLLAEMTTPTLVVASATDPMIPAEALRTHLLNASPAVSGAWIHRGGHVFFPPGATIGVDKGTNQSAGIYGEILHSLENLVRKNTY